MNFIEIKKIFFFEKYLKNLYLIRELYSENIKNSYNSIIKEKTTQLKNWMKDLNSHFSKDTQMASKHRKRYSTVLINREMQLKTEPNHTHHNG